VTKDFGISFKGDGSIDLGISSTGDLRVVGGNEEDDIKVKKELVLQDIRMALITPFGSLPDPNDSTGETSLNFGNIAFDYLGKSQIADMIIGSCIYSAVILVNGVEDILGMDLEKVTEDGKIKVRLQIKVTDDEDILDTIVVVG
jgi:hypothetical protein